jgi:hypothetical protein
MMSNWVTGFSIGLVFGVPLGFIAAIAQGGAACLKYSILRLFLGQRRYLPFNIRQFLDFAVECILIRKVGGGYVFVHALLLDHFVRWSKESQAKTPPSLPHKLTTQAPRQQTQYNEQAQL